MAYDITAWKTKQLSDFKIPVSAFFLDEIRHDWRINQCYINSTGDVVFGVGGTVRIIGRLDVDGETGRSILAAINESNRLGMLPTSELGFRVDPSALFEYELSVSSINVAGQFSGGFWNECLKFTLTKSSGILIAVRVWEGGDYIDQLFVRNGEILESPINL